MSQTTFEREKKLFSEQIYRAKLAEQVNTPGRRQSGRLWPVTLFASLAYEKKMMTLTLLRGRVCVCCAGGTVR